MMKSVKTCLTGTILGLQLAIPFHSLAADTSFADIQRDVEVMSHALQAASASPAAGTARVARIEGLYLADQGVVFRIHARGLSSHGSYAMFDGMNWENFGEDIGTYVDGIVSDVEISLSHLGENLSSITDSEHGSKHVMVMEDFDWADEMDQVAEQISEQSQKLAQQIRELRREQSASRREYHKAQQKFENEMENFEQKIEQGNSEQEARTVLEQAEKGLTSARDSYRQGRLEYAKKLEAIRSEQRAKRQQKITELAKATMDNFCRYGTSLRSLPNDEHINLIFDGMGDSDSRESDLVYVVKKSDFSDCQSNKIDGEKLLGKATSYKF